MVKSPIVLILSDISSFRASWPSRSSTNRSQREGAEEKARIRLPNVLMCSIAPQSNLDIFQAHFSNPRASRTHVLSYRPSHHPLHGAITEGNQRWSTNTPSGLLDVVQSGRCPDFGSKQASEGCSWTPCVYYTTKLTDCKFRIVNETAPGKARGGLVTSKHGSIRRPCGRVRSACNACVRPWRR